MTKTRWYSLSVEACLEKLDSCLEGLSQSEAKKRLFKYGQNEINISKAINVWQRVFHQFNNILIYILLLAAIVTGVIGHWVDCSVIIGVILLNALIGFIQEGKAEKSIDALKKILPAKAIVMRDGERLTIDAKDIVCGDIVLFTAGDLVPADLRLIEANNLQIDESILTGESMPIDKNNLNIKGKVPLSARFSIAYSGTSISYGYGIGVVIATGKNTEMGQISSLLEFSEPFSTPLLRQIKSFGHILAIGIVCVSLSLFLFGFFIKNFAFEKIFMIAVAITVSIIPEGLPAIITIILAIGVTRMSKRNAVIRRLASVETLSSVSVICTDKTGTLTKNELSVQQIVCATTSYDITGSGYNDNGKILQNNQQVSLQNNNDLSILLKTAILCNLAILKNENGSWKLDGNPMDGALLALALKAGVSLNEIKREYVQTDVIPFNSENKLMASLHHDSKSQAYIFVKGAPETILSKCIFQLDNKSQLINKQYWKDKINSLAKNGMRVLAFAYKSAPATQSKIILDDLEKDLILIAVLGIIDPPRNEAKEAIASCQRAGIRIKMITGDHGLTAKAIASQIGIASEKSLSGVELDMISDEALANCARDIDIYYRTVPEHKIRLIKALQKDSQIIAMTGDGVNDAPALHCADIGIAMGIKGTDIAKEASEMVLADDNFSSIKYAVEEGRNVYNNLKKALLFILPNDGAEGLSIFFAILFGFTLPITPLQILWVNMVTAVTLALAIAFEPPDKNLMEQRPRDPKEPLLSKFLIWRIVFVSLLFLGAMFGLFINELHGSNNVAIARTMVVNVLVLLEAVYLLNCRRIYDSVLSIEGLFGSKSILIAIFLVILMQLSFTYLPFMQYLFKTESLNLMHWVKIISVSWSIFFIIEFEKMLLKNYRLR